MNNAVYDHDDAYSSDQCQKLHRTMHCFAQMVVQEFQPKPSFMGSTAETHQCLQREHCQSLWAAWRRAAWRPPASQASPVDPAQKATNSTTGQVTGSLDPLLPDKLP